MAQQVEYLINDVLQSYSPGVPDPSQYLALSETSVIGYADTIKQESRDFEVRTVIETTAESTASYEAWLVQNYGVTHNGDQVVHNGEEVVDFRGGLL